MARPSLPGKGGVSLTTLCPILIPSLAKVVRCLGRRGAVQGWGVFGSGVTRWGVTVARACKENKSNRIMTKSDFSEAGPMNEMVAMGVLAIRLQALNKTLEWDGANMCFTNIGDNETIRTVIKDGFKIHDGHPTFDKTWTDPINAKQFAAELVKHTYRDGWRLPDMPR